VLYRIVRGTGLVGLAGIPYRRDIFVRPLLDVTRGQILRYLHRRSIPFVEDPSNADTRFARARIRHAILPALARENPRVAEALRALAAAAREHSFGNPGRVADARSGHRSFAAMYPSRPEPSRDDARRAELAGSSRASSPAPHANLSRRAAATVARLVSRGGTATIDVAGGRRVEVSYGRVRVEKRRRGREARAAPAADTIPVDGPGTYRWPAGGVIAVREGAARGGPGQSSAGEEFDADRLAWPLLMRARRPGDKMRPRGGRGSRKLSDLMIDAKIARPLRGMLPVVTTADDVVLFVPGLRPAEAGRPSATTRRRVTVCFEGASVRTSSPLRDN
jgi:tRNA(Ile)-lysidine synthase